MRERVSIGFEPIQHRREHVDGRAGIGATGRTANQLDGQRFDVGQRCRPEGLVVQLAKLVERDVSNAVCKDAELPRNLS